MFRTLIAAFALILVTASASSAGDWVRLGERHVSFVSDHDTIPVGRHDGKFVKLKLKVHKAEIKLNSIKVVFGNGEIEEVIFDHHIHEGGEADITLPHGWHEGRFIQRGHPALSHRGQLARPRSSRFVVGQGRLSSGSSRLRTGRRHEPHCRRVPIYSGRPAFAVCKPCKG